MKRRRRDRAKKRLIARIKSGEGLWNPREGFKVPGSQNPHKNHGSYS